VSHPLSPTGTPSDSTTIKVIATDDDGAVGTRSANLTVTPAGGVSIDLAGAGPQLVNAGAALGLTIADPAGLENVIGTTAADTIIGNSRDNRLAGADFAAGTAAPHGTYNGSEQWVLLDFDSETNLSANGEFGEHEYTSAERGAIEAAMEFDYHGPGGAADPWFHVWITQDPAEVTAAIRTAGEFVTIYFNKTPSFGRPGGESDDPRGRLASCDTPSIPWGH
jgi:hypothetical protein